MTLISFANHALDSTKRAKVSDVETDNRWDLAFRRKDTQEI